jgi:hypothetical protein
MKIVILSGILFLLFVNILAQKTITCKKGEFEGYPACIFSGVTIGPNKTVTIETDPANLDVNSIIAVVFESSSIHSVPSEVFTKFPNLKVFRAVNVKLQEVLPNAFEKGKKLEQIRLGSNELTFLHLNTFKGEFFHFFFAMLISGILFQRFDRIEENWVGVQQVECDASSDVFTFRQIK